MNGYEFIGHVTTIYFIICGIMANVAVMGNAILK